MTKMFAEKLFYVILSFAVLIGAAGYSGGIYVSAYEGDVNAPLVAEEYNFSIAPASNPDFSSIVRGQGVSAYSAANLGASESLGVNDGYATLTSDTVSGNWPTFTTQFSEALKEDELIFETKIRTDIAA